MMAQHACPHRLCVAPGQAYAAIIFYGGGRLFGLLSAYLLVRRLRDATTMHRTRRAARARQQLEASSPSVAPAAGAHLFKTSSWHEYDLGLR